jgi:hypothetical protein
LSWSEVSPPGNELQRVGEEIIVNPFSKIHESSFLRRIQFSLNIFIIWFITIGKVVLGVRFTFIYQPVTELTHNTNKLTTLFANFELESSDSDNISDTVDSWSSVWSLRIDDQGTELMEFKSVVSGLNSLVMEAWINNLKLCDKVRTVIGFCWLRDIYDNTPT